MRVNDSPDRPAPVRRRRWWPFGLLAMMVALVASGCSLLDEQERRWIFNPSKVSWNGGASAHGLQDVWIDYASKTSGSPVRLHGLWMPQASAKAPTLLYLHGARWDVSSSAGRMRRMHALGFSVLGVDYRGFGRSTDVLPSEAFAQEDAAAAWAWLGAERPAARRFVYGHSLGSAIAVRLAAEAAPADAPAGVVLEGAFTSIPDVLGTFRYGWLPLRPFVTQRFDSSRRIAQLHMPLLMLHGADDHLIPPALGRELFDEANEPKRFLLIEGGSHHDASALAASEIGAEMRKLGMLTSPTGLRASGQPTRSE
jgi:alpha-beta hydrolase superfamily lysophospholipase